MNSMNNFMKIGILGGTFNPVHKSHIDIALAAFSEYHLNKVILLPGGQPPHKKNDSDIISKEDRYEMIRLICEDYPMLEPERYEIDKTDFSYTYESLRYFNNKYREASLYFILGEDSLYNLESWMKPEDIMKSATLLVARRNNGNDIARLENQINNLTVKYSAKIKLISKKVEYISSTVIRQRLSQGLDCSRFLPEKAENYIKSKGFYRN